ncbi:ATP-grasp domain-containing protein [Actinomadura graeca]|uniref:ATP-grasp domain-containing protein n=1 Tax=Actinomadura graeca TaxID=2750812 RepID=A0ABX8QS74_9ACTN|nr:ATP-grasp domain-containing protein [Actinomadura graeca]QXJ21628.1 ATP-grasp domain-containing protein [Actinomadura graeca]
MMGERPPRILIVEPVSSGTRLVEDCRALGAQVVVASADSGDRLLSDGLRDLADQVLVVETNDEEALVRAVDRALPLDAVLPGVELGIPAAARVGHRLGVTSLSPETAAWVRNKALMRSRAAAMGVRVPRFAEARSVDELEKAAAEVGFPCVLKPVDSSGSVHVSRADDLSELRWSYLRMEHDRRLDLGRTAGSHVVVEEYVCGPEYSADGYVLDGRVSLCSLTRKFLGPEPYFVELGHIVSSENASPEVIDQVERYVRQVLEALQISFGPFHCELRLSADGPILIEIGARLPGDRITDLIEMATGVSLSRVMVACYLGLPPESADAFGTAQAKCAGIRFFDANGKRSFTRLEGWAELGARPDVVETGLSFRPGDDIPSLEDFRGRIGYAIFTADSARQAERTWRELGDAIRVI